MPPSARILSAQQESSRAPAKPQGKSGTRPSTKVKGKSRIQGKAQGKEKDRARPKIALMEPYESATVTEGQPEVKIDGRRARSARARDAILRALWSLLQEGNLNPSAPRIADRAGVSLRLVFHHFSDMQSILRDLMQRQSYRAIESTAPISDELTREQRMNLLVDQRAHLFEIITPIEQAAIMQESTSALIANMLSVLRKMQRAQVTQCFAPDLASLPLAERRTLGAALISAASWAFWDTLRSQQKLTVPAARRVMALTLEALLRDVPPPQAPAVRPRKSRA